MITESILVAEDLEEDVALLKRAFTKAGIKVPLHFVRNGHEAISYLGGEQPFTDRRKYPLPALLLLDLKMPISGGFDVLEWLCSQPGLDRLPVVVFTSSDAAEDINRAYDLGANSYLVKPSQINKLEDVARFLESYWLKLNRSPEYAPRPPEIRRRSESSAPRSRPENPS